MGCRRALNLIFVVLTVLSVSDRALGAEADVLSVTASDDVLAELGVTRDRLQYLVHVEIAASSSTDVADLRAFVDPTTDGEGVAITLVDRASSRTDSRVVMLAKVEPSARARVVALALAEMVRAHRSSATPSPSAGGAPPKPPAPDHSEASKDVAPPSASSRPAPPPQHLSIDGMAGLSQLPKRGSTLFEARVAGERLVTGFIWARAQIGVAVGAASDPLGDARLTLPSLALGLRARSDPGATFSVGFGPTLDAGVAFASGSSAMAHASSDDALTLRASLDADLRARLGPALFVVVAASGGYLLRGAELRADDRVIMGASGAALGALCGLGATWP